MVYYMNKEIVAGIIFMSIWVVVILAWGWSKDYSPDYSSDYQDYRQNSEQGHPIW